MPPPRDPVAEIHKAVAANRYRFGWHAVQHMFEEGFDTANVREVLARETDCAGKIRRGQPSSCGRRISHLSEDEVSFARRL